MKPPAGRSSWVVTLPLLLAAVSWLALAFLPARRQIEELRRELQSRQDFISAADQLVPVIAAARAELDTTHEYIGRWQGQPASSASFTALFGQIAQLTQDAGVSGSRFAPGRPVPQHSICQLPIELEFAASYPQAVALVAGIERLAQRVWIESLAMEQSGEYGKEIRCKLSLVVFAEKREESD